MSRTFKGMTPNEESMARLRPVMDRFSDEELERLSRGRGPLLYVLLDDDGLRADHAGGITCNNGCSGALALVGRVLPTTRHQPIGTKGYAPACKLGVTTKQCHQRTDRWYRPAWVLTQLYSGHLLRSDSSRLDETLPDGEVGRLGATSDSELAVRFGDMIADRVLAHLQGARDLLVGHTSREQP